MTLEHRELDDLQDAYMNAMEEWITAIRFEEALASGDHRAAALDRWEPAHEVEEAARRKAKAAKIDYQAALRKAFFDF